MRAKKRNANRAVYGMFLLTLGLVAAFGAQAGTDSAMDLPAIRQAGVLRHLGVPYANFITGSGDGMDMELVQRFAAHLGVTYEYVPTTWPDVIADLTGKKVMAVGDQVEITGTRAIRGHLIANGLTIIPWRKKVIDYSTPTFPTQIWLMARADSTLKPITPSGDIDKDIDHVMAQIKSRSVLGKADTCLDPSLYGVADAGALVSMFKGTLNELAPAIINGEAEATLLDVPDALIALEKWPGQVKVIGPLSHMQNMGVGFDKSTPLLRDAFNAFLQQCKKDGTYLALVKKYYPAVFKYYPDFFENH